MLTPLSTPIINNPTNLSLWGGAGTANIAFGSSGGYLLANATSPNYAIASYIYILNTYINIRDLTFSFSYKKVDTNNSEIEIGYKSVSGAEYSAYLNIKNVGNLTTFTIKRRGALETSTFALASNVLLNEEIQVTVRMYNAVAVVNIVRADGKSITETVTGIDFNTSVFALSPVLGNHSIRNLQVYSEYTSQPSIHFYGDSITALYDSRADYCGRTYNSYVKTAGGGDRTVDVILGLPVNNNFIAPITVVLIGTNDVSTAYPLASFRSDIQYIYDFLSRKSTVFFLEILPRSDAYDTRPYTREIYNIVPVNRIIPTFAVLKNAGNDLMNPIYTFDGLHPNALGASKLGKFEADFLRASGF